MPTITGKFQLADFDTALTVRGFDSYQQVERYQMINLGYREVARKFPWSWAHTSQSYTPTVGTATINVGTGLPAGVDSIEAVYITTDPYRSKLEPESQQRFMEWWLPLDLTAAANRGTPARYYYFGGNIYILPPPQSAVTILVNFKQYLPDLINVGDVTVLPQVFDEVVLDAALVRCHRRAHELQLAADAQDRVDIGINDLLQDDVWEMEELQERTLPDNQWY